MKQLFWIIVFIIAFVKCEHSGHISQQQFAGATPQFFIYPNSPQQYHGLHQLQYQQPQLQFNAGFLRHQQQINAGFLPHQQQHVQHYPGLQLQYQQQQVPLQYFPQLHAQQLPIQQLHAQQLPVHQLPVQQFLPQQLPAHLLNPFGLPGPGISKFPIQQFRSPRVLQLPYTRAIASQPQSDFNPGLLNAGIGQPEHQKIPFIPSQPDLNIGPQLSLPLPSFLQPQNLISPASNDYFAPSPQSNKAEKPEVVAPAPPLPQLPEQPRQFVAKDNFFAIFNSIPLAEGHSVGSNIAYTYGKNAGPAFDEITFKSQQAFPAFQPQPLQGSTFQGPNLGYGGLTNTPIKTVKVLEEPAPYPGNVKLLKIFNENYSTPEDLYNRYGTEPVKFVNIYKGAAAQQLIGNHGLNNQLLNYGHPGGYELNSFQNVPLLENLDINPYAYGGANYGQDFANLFKNVRKRASLLKKGAVKEDDKKA